MKLKNLFILKIINLSNNQLKCYHRRILLILISLIDIYCELMNDNFDNGSIELNKINVKSIYSTQSSTIHIDIEQHMNLMYIK